MKKRKPPKRRALNAYALTKPEHRQRVKADKRGKTLLDFLGVCKEYGIRLDMIYVGDEE